MNFDTTSYLAAYPDVAAANINPLVHYFQFGMAEGRQPSPMACGDRPFRGSAGRLTH